MGETYLVQLWPAPMRADTVVRQNDDKRPADEPDVRLGPSDVRGDHHRRARGAGPLHTGVVAAAAVRGAAAADPFEAALLAAEAASWNEPDPNRFAAWLRTRLLP